MNAIEHNTMSPQEKTRTTMYTDEQLAKLANAQAHSMLGVSWDQAAAMLDRGDLDGTAAEAELKMLRFMLSA